MLSADTDFGALLAARGSAKPSVALFRGRMSRRPEFLANLLLSQLAALERFLIKGAIVVIEPTRIRVRDLPIGQSCSASTTLPGQRQLEFPIPTHLPPST